MEKPNVALGLEPFTGADTQLERENALSAARINSKTIGIGIFFGAIIMLIFYLVGLRFHADLPVPVFFISIGLIILSLLYQIFFFDLTRGFSGMVIFEITLAAIAFHYIYSIPTYGLYGTDPYFDATSVRAILESGHIAGVPAYVQITSFFPVLHIMGAQISLITGIDYLSIAKWFPAIIGSITIPMMYLLVRFLFKSTKAALLAALFYTCIQHYIMFESLFVRETIGIIMAVSSMYFFTTAVASKHPIAYRSLAIISLGGTIVAHHLTSVMLMMLLAIYWIFSLLSRVNAPGLSGIAETNKNRMSLSFLLIGIVGTLAYWLTTVVQPMQIGVYYLDNILTPSVWGSRTILNSQTAGIGSLNLRYNFLVFGSYISYAIFGLILLYKSFSRRGSHFLETPVFTLYLVICGALGFLSYFVLPATIGGDRFLAFGWLFAAGPLALAIIEFKNKLMIGVSAFMILFFLFINLFTIHPTIWDPNSSGVGGAASREDFAMAKTVDFSDGEILTYQNDIMTIYAEQNKLGTDAYFLFEPVDINRYKWVIINRKALVEEGLYTTFTKEAIEKMAAIESGDNPDYNRLYESNNLAVLQAK